MERGETRGIIKDVVRMLERDFPYRTEVEESAQIYLNQGREGFSPRRLVVGLAAIGARTCGFEDEGIEELLTKLHTDGAFGEKREAPTIAIVSGTEDCPDAGVWGRAIAALGKRLTKDPADADVIVVLNANAAAVRSMKELNSTAKIVAFLPVTKSVTPVLEAGATFAYYSLISSRLEHVLRALTDVLELLE